MASSDRPWGAEGLRRRSDDEERCARAVELAAALLEESGNEVSAGERRRRKRIAWLVEDQESRAFLLELTDQVLRIRTARRAARRFRALVHAYPHPALAGPVDRVALRAGALAAVAFPGPVVALATARLRRELQGLVLPAEAAPLRRHLLRRRREGMRLNVNLLGEAVLGEGQAEERRRHVIELLGRPEIDCVSVKLSALYSQLDVVAYDHSVEALRARLRPVLELAARSAPKKLVNVDMEEYRDLHLTVDVLCSLLAEDGLMDLFAGVALQAYLPDCPQVLERLCAFARGRVADGGAPVRVRLVKGANLAMERVEAELSGWEQAPYAAKEEVDANYKRLLDIALRPENDGAVIVGVASHNLFDVAWALVVVEGHAPGRVEIEMLEGMAPALAKAVARRAGGLLLYAPVVRRGDFESAVAYLVRRFDENTAPDNFLAHLPSLSPSSLAWEDQRARFEVSVARRLLPASAPRRTAQLASVPLREPRAGGVQRRPFANASDTDFSLAANRAALEAAIATLPSSMPALVPALVDGEVVEAPANGISSDPSDPACPLYRYVQADSETVERAVAVGVRAARRWRDLPAEARAELLLATADELEGMRARSIATMQRDAGKVVAEADREVSEAVDGARYSAHQARALASRHGPAGQFSPYGVVVVVPPWNFPMAIPAGGTFGALGAGNAVILKPAPETVLTASLLVEAAHRAGIPGDVLQFLPTQDAETGRRLVTHEKVSAVVLTGAFDTARMFLGWRPALVLHAETSGKNALVVTASADQEDAVRDIVRSAFSHAGQKCSAASLAILEAPVYDDPVFLGRLADAVASLPVGPATDLWTKVGPLIRPPSGTLLRQLTTLDPGERWLVEPAQVGSNPHLWSPGVKIGVAPGSQLHQVECFGPVLGLMRAEDLTEALELQNATSYGLTGGISSLDDHEVARWREAVDVGNAYVNRHITGAIVGRQPFGGWKRSAIGPGHKAGGPNYVASLGRWSQQLPLDLAAERARAKAEARRLVPGVDEARLRSEHNVFRLRPLRRAVLRLGAAVDPSALALSLAVAHDLGVAVQVSVGLGLGDVAAALQGAADRAQVRVEPRFERIEALLVRFHAEPVDRVRLLGADPAERLALLDAGAEVDVEPLVGLGTYELARWTREQSVSTAAHRHGNVVGARRRGA